MALSTSTLSCSRHRCPRPELCVPKLNLGAIKHTSYCNTENLIQRFFKPGFGRMNRPEGHVGVGQSGNYRWMRPPPLGLVEPAALRGGHFCCDAGGSGSRQGGAPLSRLPGPGSRLPPAQARSSSQRRGGQSPSSSFTVQRTEGGV